MAGLQAISPVRCSDSATAVAAPGPHEHQTSICDLSVNWWRSLTRSTSVWNVLIFLIIVNSDLYIYGRNIVPKIKVLYSKLVCQPAAHFSDNPSVLRTIFQRHKWVYLLKIILHEIKYICIAPKYFILTTSFLILLTNIYNYLHHPPWVMTCLPAIYFGRRTSSP